VKRLDGEAGTAMITDHPFRPRGEWWSLCADCRMAESAHQDTMVKPEDRAPCGVWRSVANERSSSGHG
jgi:hypothetical protein